MKIKKILTMVVVWRLVLFIFLFFALLTVPLQLSFLGGGLSSYLSKPYLWSWINFDGEHYLAIAFRGYRDLEYFYFPLYPLTVRAIAKLFSSRMTGCAVAGLVISHASFLIGFIGLIRLINMDYKKKIAFYSVLLLLLFPTSFYFGSFYTESLFFALSVWSFYFARKKKWLLAGMLGGLSTATRVVGLALLPALLIEVIGEIGGIRKIGKIGKIDIKKILGILLIPSGLTIYMIYLNKVVGDPLEFLHSVSIFGQQRSSTLVSLPQVFYRYIFKILPSISYNYFPVVFSTWLEFMTAVIFGGLGVLGILGRIKLRTSYVTYLIAGYLIPTLSGSFSSLPRYVLVLFPAYIIGSLYLSKLPKVLQAVVFALLFVSLGIATVFFVRGYWVA